MATGPRIDALTGLPDKPAFERQLSHHWNLALCQRTSLALLLIEVDFIQPPDDALGRARGDSILQRIAISLQENLGRWNDFAARTGDRSFAVVLPGTDRSGATAMAERLLEAMSALETGEPPAAPGPPDCSRRRQPQLPAGAGGQRNSACRMCGKRASPRAGYKR